MNIGVIFDADGVLFDSEKLEQITFPEAFVEYGITLDHEDVMHSMGVSNRDYMPYIKKKYGKDIDWRDFNRRKIALHKAIVEERGLEVFDGIRDLIEALRMKHIPFAVASSSDPERVRFNLETTGLAHYFSVIITSYDVTRSKPDPEIFLIAAESISRKPEECAVLEDSIPGVQAANNAGMKCIALTNTFPRKELVDADLVLNSARDISVETLEQLIDSR